MDYLRIGINAFSNSWNIPIRLNGKTTGVIALEELACSILLIAQKHYSAHATPRIDHVLRLLTIAKQIMKNVPLTFMYLDDSVHALERLPQKCTAANLCKTAACVSGLFAQTLGLLEFIDEHGGHTLSKLVLWDQLYLRSIAAKVGSSRIFHLLGITTLGNLKNAWTITSSISTIAHSLLNFRKKWHKYDTKIALEEIQAHRPELGNDARLRAMQGNILQLRRQIQTEKRTLYFLKIANETCKIASVFVIGSATWPVLSFGLVGAVLLVSQEVYKRSVLDKKREAEDEKKKLQTLLQ